MSYRQVYNPSGYVMNGYPGGRVDPRNFSVPYIDNGPAVFSSNSTTLEQRNSYPPPQRHRSSHKRSSYRLHPTIPEVPYPPSPPPPPPPPPPLRQNFHPANRISRPVSIKRPIFQPPPPPPPPPPPTTSIPSYPQHFSTRPLSIQRPSLRQRPPPPPESSISSEDQQTKMEDLVDAAGPPDYDSERANYDSDDPDDNHESSTNQESDEMDALSDHTEREAQTQTQYFDDDDDDNDGNEVVGNHVGNGNVQSRPIPEEINELPTVTTHDAGVGTDEPDRPPPRRVTIHENHDLGWQRRTHRSQTELDEVEAPWARLSPRQLSGKRFRDDRRPRVPPPRQQPQRMEARPVVRRENYYHAEQRDPNGNLLDHRLPIMNPVQTKQHHHDMNQNRQYPRKIHHDNPVYRDEYIRYEPRQTYFPPRQPDERIYKQKQFVDTRTSTHQHHPSHPSPKNKEKPTILLCTGFCVIVLLVFAFLVLVALSTVLAYYFTVYDENTTNHPCSSLPSIENGVYTGDTTVTNTFADEHTFECNSGYAADPDTREISCESDLTWDYTPLCIVPDGNLSSEEIGLLAGAVGAGGLALGFLIIMMCMACSNLFGSRNKQYEI